MAEKHVRNMSLQENGIALGVSTWSGVVGCWLTFLFIRLSAAPAGDISTTSVGSWSLWDFPSVVCSGSSSYLDLLLIFSHFSLLEMGNLLLVILKLENKLSSVTMFTFVSRSQFQLGGSPNDIWLVYSFHVIQSCWSFKDKGDNSQ